jgi:peptidoglycan/LPS O-acetylase OafA/YrhL
MKNHIRELDGLRGVAVILVIALHTFNRASYFTTNPVLLFFTKLAAVGWVGVDIFFTLSGFLITSILLQAREKGDYFKNFYARRVLRIFPLYYIAIMMILLFAPKIEEEFLSQLPKILPAMLLYQQNWLFVFSDLRITQYLAVTWSLAIEEQFYLLWPLIVFFLKKGQLLKVSIWLIGLSILARVVSGFFWSHTPDFFVFFYYNSFTRFEEILIGGLLAVFFTYQEMREKIQKYASPLFLISLAFFLILCFMTFSAVPNPLYDNIPLTIFGYSLAAVFSASLIGVFITHPEESLLRKFFSHAVLQFFGRYSYSMYLFHMSVVFLLMEYFWHTRMRGWHIYLLYAGLVFALTALIGWLTWHLLEKHILYFKKYFVTE